MEVKSGQSKLTAVIQITRGDTGKVEEYTLTSVVENKDIPEISKAICHDASGSIKAGPATVTG